MTVLCRLTAVLVLLCASACGGKGGDPQNKGKPVPLTKSDAGPKPIAGRSDAPTPVEPVAGGGAAVEAAPPPTEPAADEKADPLGQRFMDPSWFRKDMLEGAKSLDVSRSEKNEKGLFSSQILFELPAGTTTEQCADQLTDKVKGDVTNLQRTTEADGRIKMTGSTERYRATLMCGEAKGVMRAYVSFEWTS
jgi:hypothetical protein